MTGKGLEKSDSRKLKKSKWRNITGLCHVAGGKGEGKFDALGRREAKNWGKGIQLKRRSEKERG